MRSLASKQAGLFALGAAAVLQFGCALTRPNFVLTPDERAALELARRELQVLPVYTDGFSSAFPIDSRRAIMADHALYFGCSFVAVRGMPMHCVNGPRLGGDVRALPPARDWVIIRAKQDRFAPNIIDGCTPLLPGHVVFLGGYPADPPSSYVDPLWHAQRSPSIVVGRVIGESQREPGVVEVEVPQRANYIGMSGGPAAIVDADGNVRVWGVIVWFGYRGNVLGFRSYLKVARLPPDILHSTDVQIVTPTTVVH
jgi:hypothetical protein